MNSIKVGLEALSKFQEELDQVTWLFDQSVLAKLRHISLHLSVMSGVVAGLSEKWEHEILTNETAVHDPSWLKPEVLEGLIPDLLIHAAQLSNMIDADLFELLSKKVTKNIQRFAPDSNLSLDPKD